MKLLFEAEDCIVGIGVGLLMVGLSGKYFSLPDLGILWGVAFFLSFLMTLFDVAHTFTDMAGHPLMLVILLLNNAADGIIEIALTAKYFGFQIPKISAFLNPLFDKPEFMFAIGVFFLVSSVFWLIYFPFMQ